MWYGAVPTMATMAHRSMHRPSSASELGRELLEPLDQIARAASKVIRYRRALNEPCRFSRCVKLSEKRQGFCPHQPGKKYRMAVVRKQFGQRFQRFTQESLAALKVYIELH